MTSPKVLTRIITCQGGIQLITALAAMSTRESERKQSDEDYEYHDFLVIYDLYSPHGQLEAFAGFVEKMALAICNLKGIVHFRPEQMDGFAASLENSNAETVFARVQELVGTSRADEIYLCRNWQFGNRLMINAYRNAEKICYGDGIGLYFSEAYFSPATGYRGLGIKAFVRGKLRDLKTSLQTSNRPATSNVLAQAHSMLGDVDFDSGYFLLPNILDQEPPMKTRLVKKESTERIFRELAAALDTEHIADKYEYLARVPTVVLMTSNFSEAARMSGENEILAYRKFIERLELPREATLVIKPHPRDGEEKIRQIGVALGDLFSDVVLLTDPNLFFVPFEIFLMQTFRGETERALRNLKIITFSTACLSIEVLFNVAPIVGFGREIVRKFFYESYVRGRIRHEHDLQVALQKLAQVA